MTGGSDINALGLLPDKLKTELALHVNLGTLRKVKCYGACIGERQVPFVTNFDPFCFQFFDFGLHNVSYLCSHRFISVIKTAAT